MVTAERAPEQREHPLIGSVLRGTYRVERLVDSQGVGLVFEAQHLRLPRRVAIKVLKHSLLANAEALARFEREAESFTQLEHPNIVQVMDFDTTELGEPYWVMECLAGKTLAAVFETGCQLALNRAARITYQIASALDAGHRAHILHRDLKPTNVFLVDVPEGTWVKLLDFGLSQRLARAHHTGEHLVLETPQYLAPEQVLGQAGEASSDQYALAVLAFQALAGHTPFLGSASEVIEQVVSNQLTPLAHFRSDVPPSVDAVLRKAMARDPAERFASPLEFAEALLATAGVAGGLVHTSREFADTEPPPPPPRSLQRPANLEQLIAQSRESFGLGDVDLAARYMESALALSERLGDSTIPELEQASLLLQAIIRERLGTQPKLKVDDNRVSEVSLLPEQAFLVSRIEGPTTVEEILDVSHLSRVATFRHLLALIRLGVLVVE